nr:facilitated trehalose transporter Tret1-like [Cherax quadricarinatus]XP_053635275.1 facilitated trehalose transporter Tret1-like [Cherax quadricarinatus]
MMNDVKEGTLNLPQTASNNMSGKNEESCSYSLHDMDNNKKNVDVEAECVATPQHPPEGDSRQNILQNDTKPAIGTQVFATLVMALMQVNTGALLAFSGITLPQLTDPQTNDLFLNQSQTAFFGSLGYLAAAVGSCVSGPLLVKLGRRVSLLVTLPITVASWLSLALSPTVWLLLTSRAILGIIDGIVFTATYLYTIEIAHNNIRGILSGIISLARLMGLLMVSSLGVSKLDWRQMGFVCCGVSALPFFCLILLPNSPRWLVTQDRFTEAQKALLFLRGKHYDSGPEFQEIIQQISTVDKKLDKSWQQVRLLFEPSTARVFLLLTVLTLLTSTSGSYVIMSYSVPIFQTVDSTLDPYISAIIFYVVRVFGNLVHLCVIDRLGRKLLIIVSFSLCSVCMATYGVYFYIHKTANVSGMGWIPLTAAMIFVFFFGIGQPAIFILNGELLPITCRSIGKPVLSLSLNCGAFISTYIYPMTVEALGEHGTFWLFSGASALITFVSAAALPETRGRSLEEITGNHINNWYQRTRL